MEECMRINNTKRSLILLLALMLWITASAALAEHTTRRARARHRLWRCPKRPPAPWLRDKTP